MFQTPVVLLCFRRYKSIDYIIGLLKQIDAKNIYICSDYGRNDDEISDVLKLREVVNKKIDWDCHVNKFYANENIGVYQNIAMNALKIFSIEKQAIFLEDDNIPNITFFRYCEDMLNKYCDNDEVFMINGTNYYPSLKSKKHNYDYFFHNQLLPCGWASWSNKFLKYYDKNLDHFKLNYKYVKQFKPKGYDNYLFKCQYEMISREKNRQIENKRYVSWDYHLIWSIWFYKLLCIAPMVNLITNDGDDVCSTHNSEKNLKKKDVRKFLYVQSSPISFPLKHNNRIAVDYFEDKKIQKIIKPSFLLRIKSRLVALLKKIHLR